jgi:hypothetical protein
MTLLYKLEEKLRLSEKSNEKLRTEMEILKNRPADKEIAKLIEKKHKLELDNKELIEVAQQREIKINLLINNLREIEKLAGINS